MVAKRAKNNLEPDEKLHSPSAVAPSRTSQIYGRSRCIQNSRRLHVYSSITRRRADVIPILTNSESYSHRGTKRHSPNKIPYQNFIPGIPIRWNYDRVCRIYPRVSALFGIYFSPLYLQGARKLNIRYLSLRGSSIELFVCIPGTSSLFHTKRSTLNNALNALP